MIQRLLLALALLSPLPGLALEPVETPFFATEVAAGRLPPIAARLPGEPSLALFPPGTEIGQPGGDWRWIGGSARDVRQMVVFGNARLVAYDETYRLVPDILAGLEVVEDRIFTLRLRPGHRWSDGSPFTSEDFRYFWDDVISNKELSPTGPPPSLLVEGKPPEVSFPDALTVRYAWTAANPKFLHELAGAAPLFIYRPSQYLKQFHTRYAEPEALKAAIAKAKVRNWAALHNRLDNQYRNDNPDLPTLDPWVLKTKPPAEQFTFIRNPYYHRIDARGQQLPYFDRVLMQVAEPKLIPAKVGAGEADLQARYLGFSDYSFLRGAAKEKGAHVHLWRTGRGAHLALFPNLTVADPVWRGLMRDVRFRRALSLGINRREINQVVYFGLAQEGNNSVQRASPLYNEAARMNWARFAPQQANKLLDELGLKRDPATGLRTLPDGRPMIIVVESGGESPDQADVMQLVRDAWAEIGIKALTKNFQADVFRNRLYAGETVMSIAAGAENGLARADHSPAEWVPTQQLHGSWSQWGNFYESSGKAGKPIDMDEGVALMRLYETWRAGATEADRQAAWEAILSFHADQQFIIGLISDVPQPVYVQKNLHNLPARGMYNWEPGGHLGLYRPDRFWFQNGQR
ncbi:MAG: ABC transporter substrate-binding protein [Elstera sp.]